MLATQFVTSAANEQLQATLTAAVFLFYTSAMMLHICVLILAKSKHKHLSEGALKLFVSTPMRPIDRVLRTSVMTSRCRCPYRMLL